MLEHDIGDIQRLLAGVFDCGINLPDWWDDYFAEDGTTVGGPSDRRQFSRLVLRTVAALEYRQTAPALCREPRWHMVYLKDVSRSGVAFLHAEQLFPLERLRILMPDDRIGRMVPGRQDCLIEIARCERIQERCYDIGARFLD